MGALSGNGDCTASDVGLRPSRTEKQATGGAVAFINSCSAPKKGDMGEKPLGGAAAHAEIGAVRALLWASNKAWD